MSPSDIAWGVVLASAATLQTIAIVRHRRTERGDIDGTLSSLVRRLFRVDIDRGKAVFVVAWGAAVAGWFGWHIIMDRW